MASLPEPLIEHFGKTWTLEAPVVAALADLGGRVAGFACGDGRIRLHDFETGESTDVAAHGDGAALCLAPDIRPGGFLSGGDDGRLVRVLAKGETSEVLNVQGKWIEHVASHAGEKLIAAGAGKQAILLGPKGERRLDHPSTVGGLGFAPQGKRLAVAHYGGVSLWWTASEGSAKVLPWKGSHIALSFSPDGKHVMTGMQDGELHGWRLADGQDMRMSGYAAKPLSLAWIEKPPYLASSGSEAVVLWPFSGKDGPMGKPPLEIGQGGGALVTAVAAHPSIPVVVAGFENGLAIAADVVSKRTITVKNPGDGRVSALAWSGDGRYLLIGTEEGYAGIFDQKASVAVT
jgi:WD40 repeat protein